MEIRGVKMFVAILLNIIIVLVAIFIPALVKALMNKSGWNFIENIDESKKSYSSIVASNISRERPSYSKDIDELFSSVDVDDFSIDNFFDNLQ